MKSKLREFCRYLAKQDLREVEEALAVIWFLSKESDHQEQISIEYVVATLRECRLRANVNVSRLHQKLSGHPALMTGRHDRTYVIKAAFEHKLDERYSTFFGTKIEEPVQDFVISSELTLGGRKHLEQMRREANGCYERGFYNSCAVMCRRLVECLLIEAMIKEGFEAAILDARKEIKGFGELIGLAKSKQYIKLSRSSPDLLTKVKETGDHAAHSRYYNTRKSDIDGLNPSLNQVVSELASKGGL